MTSNTKFRIVSHSTGRHLEWGSVMFKDKSVAGFDYGRELLFDTNEQALSVLARQTTGDHPLRPELDRSLDVADLRVEEVVISTKPALGLADVVVLRKDRMTASHLWNLPALPEGRVYEFGALDGDVPADLLGKTALVRGKLGRIVSVRENGRVVVDVAA